MFDFKVMLKSLEEEELKLSVMKNKLEETLQLRDTLKLQLEEEEEREEMRHSVPQEPLQPANLPHQPDPEFTSTQSSGPSPTELPGESLSPATLTPPEHTPSSAVTAVSLHTNQSNNFCDFTYSSNNIYHLPTTTASSDESIAIDKEDASIFTLKPVGFYLISVLLFPIASDSPIELTAAESKCELSFSKHSSDGEEPQQPSHSIIEEAESVWGEYSLRDLNIPLPSPPYSNGKQIGDAITSEGIPGLLKTFTSPHLKTDSLKDVIVEKKKIQRAERYYQAKIRFAKHNDNQSPWRRRQSSGLKLYEDERAALQADPNKDPYRAKKVFNDTPLAAVVGRLVRTHKEGVQMSLKLNSALRGTMGVCLSLAYIDNIPGGEYKWRKELHALQEQYSNQGEGEGRAALDGDALKEYEMLKGQIMKNIGGTKKDVGKNKLIDSQLRSPFLCFKCGKRFNFGVQLLCHMRDKKYFPLFQVPSVEIPSSTPPKPKKKHFTCKKCKRRFAKKRNLWHHIYDSHSKNKKHKQKRWSFSQPWKCPFCYKRLSTEQAWKAHKKDYRHFQCRLCQMSFHKKSHLYSHSKAKHKEQYIRDLNDHLEEKRVEQLYI